MSTSFDPTVLNLYSPAQELCHERSNVDPARFSSAHQASNRAELSELSRNIEWTNTQNKIEDSAAAITAGLFMVCIALTFVVLGGSIAYWIISALGSISLPEVADAIAGFRIQ